MPYILLMNFSADTTVFSGRQGQLDPCDISGRPAKLFVWFFVWFLAMATKLGYTITTSNSVNCKKCVFDQPKAPHGWHVLGHTLVLLMSQLSCTGVCIPFCNNVPEVEAAHRYHTLSLPSFPYEHGPISTEKGDIKFWIRRLDSSGLYKPSCFYNHWFTSSTVFYELASRAIKLDHSDDKGTKGSVSIIRHTGRWRWLRLVLVPALIDSCCYLSKTTSILP